MREAKSIILNRSKKDFQEKYKKACEKRTKPKVENINQVKQEEHLIIKRENKTKEKKNVKIKKDIKLENVESEIFKLVDEIIPDNKYKEFY